jgi:hypothetical protein
LALPVPLSRLTSCVGGNSFFSLGAMLTREQAVAILNPFRFGDGSLSVQCRGERPRSALIPSKESLCLDFPNQAWVDFAATCDGLRDLWIDRPSAKSLDGIARLPLRHLSITYPSYVRDWRFLSQLWGLRYLRLANVTSLLSLEHIAELVHLEVLILAGTYSRILKVPSLKPLSRLTNLRVVIFASFRPQDWSLAPLHEMRRLEHFSCPSSCPIEELKSLQDRHPALKLIDDVAEG